MKRSGSNHRGGESEKKRSRESLNQSMDDDTAPEAVISTDVQNVGVEGPSQSSQPQLCKNGCGFYGSPETDGICSVCFKGTSEKKENGGRKSQADAFRDAIETEISNSFKVPGDNKTELVANSSVEASDRPSHSQAGNTSEKPEDDKPKKPKKTRCSSCRKRVGLAGFDCRCGKIFCGLHRYSDQHDCDFDYKADAQAKIRKDNPVIMAEKIKKI